MQVVRHGGSILAMVILCLGIAPANAAGEIPEASSSSGYQKPPMPPLDLSQAQRVRVQEALKSQHTEVSFALKSAKSAQSFNASVGAAVPKNLTPHPLPRPLIYEIPRLKEYSYLKFKDAVLIVDPLTRKIVDILPES